MHGVRLVCHSAVAQSHRICSVWHLCVVTYGPTWLPTISSQRCISSHLPSLLMGYQFFVLTGTATSRAGSGAQFVLGLQGSPVPYLPYPLATWYLFWLGLSTATFFPGTWRRCPALLRSGASPSQSSFLQGHILWACFPQWRDT